MLRRILILVILSGLAAAPGCGRQTTDADTANQPVVVPAPASPQALGEAIGKTYQETLAEFVRAVKGHPEAKAVRELVSDLKGRTIQKMLAWGRHREALPPEDRKVADAALLATLETTNKAHWEAFTAATNHYRTIDNELANTISSLNIVTQYAAFEHLKEQSPDEARRLGIE